MCRASHRLAATVSSCASNPPIRSSIATKRASSWRRWSPERYLKLRTKNANEECPLERGHGSLKGYATVALVLSLAALSAGRQGMHDQPKYVPLRPRDFSADGRSARSITEGTVARGHLNDDTLLYTGKGPDGKP